MMFVQPLLEQNRAVQEQNQMVTWAAAILSPRLTTDTTWKLIPVASCDDTNEPKSRTLLSLL